MRVWPLLRTLHQHLTRIIEGPTLVHEQYEFSRSERLDESTEVFLGREWSSRDTCHVSIECVGFLRVICFPSTIYVRY